MLLHVLEFPDRQGRLRLFDHRLLHHHFVVNALDFGCQFLLLIFQHGNLVIEVLYLLYLALFYLRTVTCAFAHFTVRDCPFGLVLDFLVLDFIDIDKQGLAHKVIATDHEYLDFPEEIIDKLNAHLLKVVFDIFVDFFQVNNHDSNVMNHFEVHIQVPQLMLKFTQELNFHIGEDLHFVQDLIVTGVDSH